MIFVASAGVSPSVTACHIDFTRLFSSIYVLSRGELANRSVRPATNSGTGFRQRAPHATTQESWKNDKGEYETRTEWHRVYAWSNLSKFARTLQKGQLITLEGTLRYREVTDEVEGANFKHRIAEIHATSMKRLSKVEAANDPADGVDEE